MAIRCILRVLDADGQLLAWAELQAETRGNGAIWATQPFMCEEADRSGQGVKLNVHWPDLNIHITHAVTPITVQEGRPVVLAWPSDRPLMAFPTDPTPLPPVTVRTSVAIGVPAGCLGVRG